MLKEYLKKELSITLKTPVITITTFIVGGLITFFVVSWHYKERIDTYKEIITQYKERTYEIKAAGNKYTALTLLDLKTTVLNFVSKLRVFNSEWRKKESLTKPPKLNNDISRGDYFRLFEEYKDQIQELRLRFQAKYFNEYKVDAIMLRDEMLSRLNKDKYNYGFHLYVYAGDPFNMSKIPDDLERLSKMLTKIP